MMERRAFLSSAVVFLLAPLDAAAQQATKIAQIGFLSPGSASDPRIPLRLGAFRQGLRELGYVEGQSISIESRWADGRYERLPGLAAELVRLKVDTIVTYAPPAIQAAKEATGTIPIVMAGIIDPVGTGFVASLSRPGGNITGLSLMAPELVGKQLEVLKEVLPKISRVALLGNPVNAAVQFVQVGCLMSYGPSFPEMSRRAATYVDRILKGAKPAELPVEQPTKFELGINLKTARMLGLSIPPALLLRADQVIE